MKKILKIVIFTLLTPFFFMSCHKSNPVPPPEPIIPPLVADVSLLTYDTMTVDYQLPEIPSYDSNLLEITSSDTSLFTIKDTSFTDKVVIESNLENKIGIAKINFTYDDVLLDYSIGVAVNYPQTYDEAVNAFSLACIKLPANTRFNITFNFYNIVDYINFDASLEIYGWRSIVKYYNFEIGTSKTNTFEVDTNASYGTIPSRMTSSYDYTNIPSFNYLSRSVHESENNTFYIDQVEKSLNIKNSEELFWSVEHGYRPILPNGNANLNTIYNNARSICEAIDSNWTNLVKFRQLFDYLTGAVHYDYDPNLSDYGSSSMSYYLEGTLLDISDGKMIGVCDAFSKTYSLLCGIVGLPCFRSYGFPEGENTGHAWNYVQLDGNWYLVCPTWAKIGCSINDKDSRKNVAALYGGENVSLVSYDTFLASGNYFKAQGFSDLARPSVNRSSVAYSGNIDEFNYHVRNNNDAIAINTRLKDNEGYFLGNGSSLYFEIDKENQGKIEEWANLIVKGVNARNAGFAFEGEDNICCLICFLKD